METIIEISKLARKALQKAPLQVQKKFYKWTLLVNISGIETARKISSFHDEPLQGERNGQRSIRLNKQWRALYIEENKQDILITVIEVNAHDYRTR